MIKSCLSVGIIFLFVGVTIAPTINFNTVKASQQNIIKERINQRELLFQTIVDIANNKEIQRIILKSQMSRGVFLTSEFPVVTKTQIRQMYFLGLILSNVISKSRMQSMFGEYQFSSQEMQKGLSTAIEKDAILNGEMTQLSNSQCDCENRNTTRWSFPVLCSILTSMNFLGIILLNILYLGIILKIIFTVIAVIIYILMMVFHYLLSFLP